MNNTKLFSKYVLTEKTLKSYLNLGTYLKFINLKNSFGEIDFKLANKLSRAIKKWAIKMGATHYVHWFVPLTGKSAKKQISFLDVNSRKRAINKFDENSLVKGEVDASSFPSGGDRLTFKARGYTVWDYTSQIFIKNKVVHIPTVFCSYTGVALDEKLAFLRATEYLNKQATNLLHLMGEKQVKSVNCNLGIEQEYFLVNKQLFEKRKDLQICGRTLLGSTPIKSKEGCYNYLSEIKPNVKKFMHNLEEELWKVGILSKVQHSEVAPCQYEVVPVFDCANVAINQNVLLMDIMKEVANKYGFEVLLHEKPFKNVSGSGKHNNWSISTNLGVNLLDCTQVEHDVFLAVFTSVISAIDKHYDLLRVSASSLGNDFRFGGNEAPPSIVSLFIGEDYLNTLINYLKTEAFLIERKKPLNLNTYSTAKLLKDNCDRNRTAPVAFTGNKFEFRMIGSSQNTALCNTIMATIVGKEFEDINAKLKASNNVKSTLKEIIKHNIKNHLRIIFNGDCYNESWRKEASKRRLENITNCVDAFKKLIEGKNIDLFSSCGVMSKEELNIRYTTYLKTYYETVLAEANAMLYMLEKEVLPSCNRYLTFNSNLIEKLKDIGLEPNTIFRSTKQFINSIEEISNYIKLLTIEIKNVNKITCATLKAEYCRDKICPILNDIREIYDEMERHLPNEFKPFPSYEDLLSN